MEIEYKRKSEGTRSGCLEQIGREWRLNTKEKVRERDPDVYAILTNPEYRLPTVLPDGKYKAKTFTIQPYSR